MFLILLYILGPILFLGTIFFLSSHIIKEYKKYDEEQTIEENIIILKTKIKGAMDYFRHKYTSSYDSTVYSTISLKVNFLKDIIKTKDKKQQLYYYDKLFKMLYETEHRLLTNYNEVSYIIQPLNTLKDDLVNEQIEYLKEIMRPINSL